MSEKPPRILLADDDDVVRFSMSEFFTDSGFEVVSAEDGPRAITILKQEEFDLIITDLAMPGMDGTEVLLFANRNHPNTPVIVVTGSDKFRGYHNKIQIENLSVFKMLHKPLDLYELEAVINEALLSKDG